MQLDQQFKRSTNRLVSCLFGTAISWIYFLIFPLPLLLLGEEISFASKMIRSEGLQEPTLQFQVSKINLLFGYSIVVALQVVSLSVPSLRGSFSLRAQNSFILQLLMPYALYCGQMVYTSWNTGKKIFDSNDATKFLQSKVYFLPFRSRSNVVPLYVATKQKPNHVTSQNINRINSTKGKHQTYSGSYFINVS